MIVLDTDHLNRLLVPESDGASRLAMRLASRYLKQITTTIVTYEEHMRGWLVLIDRARNFSEEIESSRRLKTSIFDFDGVEVLEFDEEAADRFKILRQMEIGIGRMDLKIASIVLANNALLLSRNLVDFHKVPGLDVEDWTN